MIIMSIFHVQKTKNIIVYDITAFLMFKLYVVY